MAPSSLLRLAGLALAALAAAALARGVDHFTPPRRPAPLTRPLADGVVYERQVTDRPRPAVLHWVTIALDRGHRFDVTPPHPGGGSVARTATELLAELGLDLVIDTNFFLYPQRSWTPWHDFPGPGEPVECLGVAARAGRFLCDAPWDDETTLYLSRGGAAGFERPRRVHHAVSGRRFLVREGSVSVTRDVDDRHYPRAALGLDRAARTMTWVVVDGHQPGAREGLTLDELAVALVARDVHTAIELDGGGSAELAIRDPHPRRLSAPTHREWVDHERRVAVHLGLRFGR